MFKHFQTEAAKQFMLLQGEVVKLSTIVNDTTQQQQDFIDKRLRDHVELKPVMINSYRRITLVNKYCEERLTIDFDVTNGTLNDPMQNAQTLSQIVIAELKQPKTDRTSPFYKLMKQKRIRPFRISKFCFGMMDLFRSIELKSNRFKNKRLFIKKLNNAG
jgi:hypothetical protein